MAHVALYSPYIPKHSGGGEKYLLTIAEVASRLHPTSLLVPSPQVEETKKKLPMYGATFGLDLSKVGVLGSSIGHVKGPLHTAVETKKFSHLFAMTDGSIFPSFAKRSYFIAQVPWTRSLTIFEKVKLSSWTSILVYSGFVKGILEASWKLQNIQVLSPYVDTHTFKPGEKEHIILNVGRFFKHENSNSKRQDIVIQAFKTMVDTGLLPGYSLVLIGNIDPNPDSLLFIDTLKQQAYGYHINFLTDLSYTSLREYYARAEFYWHAAGYGVNAKEHPENTEHFGMTTLEAMASGCLPLVVPEGGQREIVQNERFFWRTPDELTEKMHSFLHLGKRKTAEERQYVREKSQHYSKEKFVKAVEVLL